MANYVSNFILKLKSEGVKETADTSAQINKNFQSAAQAVDRLSNKLPKAYAASRSGRSSSQEAEDITAYGKARGAVGTGAASRDFANQAQGLGGLVRLYATFAANIFAAGAAFRALSTAMDTTNMVKGLDQLGAASGRNLGTLSKDLAAASDGAVSLREAMEATAKASSAGLSNTQILQMGDAARKASQALGIGMPDALSRISRGISKLEPELLDELGLFVKIDDATQAYARSVGKSATSLTDFERRQAFANAVLDQAQQKFGNIEIDVNPYNKLLASFQNLVQSGLELLNKVLGPIAKILAESPTALTVALGAIGITLLKQVSPVFTEWRQNLRNAAADAADTAKRIQESFGDQFQQKLEARFKIPDLQKSIKDTEAQIAKLQKSTVGDAPASLLKKAPTVAGVVADEKSLASLEKIQATRQRHLKEHEAGTKKLTATQIQNTKAEIDWLEKKQEALRKERAELQLNTELQAKKAALEEAFGKAQVVADKPPGRLDPETIAIMQTEKARKRYDQISAVSNAAETARILGVKAAWGALRQEVEDKNIKGFSKYSTLAQGGLAAIGTRVVGVIGSFANLVPQIGLAVAAFSLVNSFLSKNSKEAGETSTSFDRLYESAKFVDQVLVDISKRDPLAQLSTASIKARAGAFQEIATAMQDSMKKITAQVGAANWWDTFTDSLLASLTFGAKGLLADSSKQLAYSVTQAFKVMNEGVKKEEAVAKFKEAFKIDPQDQEALRKVLAESPEKFMEMAPEVVEYMKKLGIEVSNTASKADELSNAFTAAEKTIKDFVTSSLPTDPISKFGAELITLGEKIEGSLSDADTAVAGLVETLGSSTRLALLDSIGQKLVQNKEELLEAARLAKVYQISLKGLDDQRKQLESKAARSEAKGYSTESIRAEIAELDKAKETVKSALDEQQKIVRKGTSDFEKAGQSAMERGTQYLQKGVDIAFARAAITLSSALAERLGGTLAGISRRAELEKQSNNLQISQLQAQKSMLDMQEAMQQAIALNTNATEINTLALKTKPGEIPTQDIKDAQDALVEQRLKILSGEGTSGQNKLLDIARKNLDAQIAQLQNANRAIDFKAFDQSAARRQAIEKDIRDVGRQQLETSKLEFDLEVKGLPYLSQAQLLRKQELDDSSLKLKQLDEQNALQLEIAKNQDTLNRKGISATDRKKAEQAIAELTEERGRLEAKQLEERRRAQANYYDFVRSNIINEANFREQSANHIREIEESIVELKKSGALEFATMELELLEQTGKLSENILIIKKAELAVQRELVASQNRRKQLDEKYLKDLEPLEERLSSSSPEVRRDAKQRIQLIVDRYNFELQQEEELTNKKIEGINKVAEYQQTSKLATSLTDAIVLSLKEGGKEGGDALRDILEAELKKPFNVVVKAILDPITTQISGFLNTLLTGTNVSGNMGSSMANSFASSLAGTAVGKAFMGAAGTASSAFSSGLAISTQGAGFGTAMTSAGNLIGAGNVGAGIMQGIGAAMPYVAIAAAVYAFAKSLDDSGTPHMGGYVSVTPDMEITDVTKEQQGIQDKNMQKMISTFAVGVSDLMNSTAKNFGDVGDYIVRAIFESDQNDPSWGIFRLLKEGTGAQAAGFFAEGTLPSGVEEGFTEFSKMAVDSIVEALGALNLPQWAKKALGTLPEDADFQALANVVSEINKIQGSIKTLQDSLMPLGHAFTEIAKLSSDSLFNLSELSGGFDNLNSNLRTYYDNFYTESEKTAMETNRISSILAKVGINELPKTVEGFRSLVDAQIALGTAGEPALAALLSVAGAFADLVNVAPSTSRVIDLQIALLEAQGYTYEALKRRREQEIKDYTEEEKAIARKIHAQEDLNATDALNLQVLNLLNQSELALKATRDKQLLGLKDADKPIQRYIWALEDEATAKNKLKASYDKLKSSLQSTINTISNNITKLKEYRDSLITGSASILTPVERYQEMKKQVQDAAAIAMGTVAATDAERQKAIDELPNLASSLLDMSRTLYASSESYTSDFNWIQGILDSTISASETLLSDTEKQLSILETQATSLELIEESTKTTAQLMEDFNLNMVAYLNAQGNTAIAKAGYTSSREDQIKGLYRTIFEREADTSGLQFWMDSGYTLSQIAAEFIKSPEYLAKSGQVGTFASGGYAEGLALVGEEGPELVDFQNPGRVYPAQQTAQLLRQENLLEELRELRKEVAKLREDQNAQTGHLIQSNYDANARAAQQIVDSNNNIVKQQTWEAKTKAVIR